MASTSERTKTQTGFCRDCGAEIQKKAEICPECGIRQQQESISVDTSGLTDQYSIDVWIVGIVVGLLTLPVGLIIPIYLYIKASNGTGAEQGSWEVWTVVFLGLFGIAAVEIGGEKGAKILWGIFAAFIALMFLAAFAFMA